MPPIPEVDYIFRQKASGGIAWGAWNLVRPAAFPAFAEGAATTLNSVGYRRYRYQGRGYTVHHIASGLTNEGTAFAGQVQGTDTTQNYVPNFTDGPSGDAEVFQTKLRPPAFPQDLVQEDSLAVQWQAKHGVYMPLRFVDTVHLYNETGPGDVARNSTGTQVSPGSFAIILAADVQGGPVNVGTINSFPVPTFVTPPDMPVATQLVYGASTGGNLMTGVMFFMGLNPAASLEVKSRMHLEAQVNRDGTVVQPFVHSPPVYDREALEIVAKVGQVQKHAYYASFNDLSNILSSIWGAIKSVGTPIVNTLGGLGIPIISDVANVAGRLIRGVEAGLV